MEAGQISPVAKRQKGAKGRAKPSAKAFAAALKSKLASKIKGENVNGGVGPAIGPIDDESGPILWQISHATFIHKSRYTASQDVVNAREWIVQKSQKESRN